MSLLRVYGSIGHRAIWLQVSECRERERERERCKQFWIRWRVFPKFVVVSEHSVKNEPQMITVPGCRYKTRFKKILAYFGGQYDVPFPPARFSQSTWHCTKIYSCCDHLYVILVPNIVLIHGEEQTFALYSAPNVTCPLLVLLVLSVDRKGNVHKLELTDTIRCYLFPSVTDEWAMLLRAMHCSRKISQWKYFPMEDSCPVTLLIS